MAFVWPLLATLRRLKPTGSPNSFWEGFNAFKPTQTRRIGSSTQSAVIWPLASQRPTSRRPQNWRLGFTWPQCC